MKIKIKKEDVKWILLTICLCTSMMTLKARLLGFLLFAGCDLIEYFRSKKVTLDYYSLCQLVFSSFIILSLYKVKYLEFYSTWSIIYGIFGTLYLAMWARKNLRSQNAVVSALKTFVVASIIGAVYALTQTPVYKLSDFFLGDYGLGSHNMLGMLSAFGTGICFYFFLNAKGKCTKSYILLLCIEIVITFLAGSRKGLAGMVMCVSMIFFLSSNNIKLLRNGCLSVLGILMLYYLSMNNQILYELFGNKMNVLVQNVLMGADSQDFSMLERSYYREQAMNLFLENPIFGVGINGFRSYMQEIGYSHVTYSHCNYTELLANYGVVGFVLYYFYKVKLILSNISELRKHKLLPVTLITFAIVLLILEYGFVAYYQIWVQFMWVVVFYGMKFLYMKREVE